MIHDAFGLVGGTIEGRYRIDRPVAEGGFGVVYAAYHLGLDVPVAVKVLKFPPDFSEEARQEFSRRFVLEAKVIAKIKHPHIVQAIDTGVSQMPSGTKSPWMVLEWIEGQTLSQILRARRGQGGQSRAMCFALMKPVLEAIAHAHEEGIAHRDIKPSNMMLAPGKKHPALCVLDFGIAKLMETEESAGSGETKTTGLAGAYSPNYASPEQVSNARTGPWTDVHALGLIISEVLTDQPPLPVQDAGERLRATLADVRPTPAKFGRDVGAWEPIIKKALAYRPEERYGNAEELLHELEAALSPDDLVELGGTSHRPVLSLTDDGLVIDRTNSPRSRTGDQQRSANTLEAIVSPNTIPPVAPVNRGRKTGLMVGVGLLVVAAAVSVFLVLQKKPATVSTGAAASAVSASSVAPAQPTSATIAPTSERTPPTVTAVVKPVQRATTQTTPVAPAKPAVEPTVIATALPVSPVAAVTETSDPPPTGRRGRRGRRVRGAVTHTATSTGTSSSSAALPVY